MGTANPDGGVFEIAPGKEGALYQTFDVFQGNVAVTEHIIHPGIVGYNAIE